MQFGVKPVAQISDDVFAGDIGKTYREMHQGSGQAEQKQDRQGGNPEVFSQKTFSTEIGNEKSNNARKTDRFFYQETVDQVLNNNRN